MSPGVAAFGVAMLTLAVLAVGGEVSRHRRERASGLDRMHARRTGYDHDRERRAERKAAELLRSVVGEDNYAMYRDLGFLRAPGRQSGGYAYLLYPHRPLIAYDERSEDLLSEYCVGFPDREGAFDDSRLPDSDDVLAKWMALAGDERGLIAAANVHVPGRQVDPSQVRRDLDRLRLWDERRRQWAGPRPSVNNLPA